MEPEVSQGSTACSEEAWLGAAVPAVKCPRSRQRGARQGNCPWVEHGLGRKCFPEDGVGKKDPRWSRMWRHNPGEHEECAVPYRAVCGVEVSA